MSDAKSFKNIYWDEVSIEKKYSNENKLHLDKYLKSKIEEAVKELLPLLILRYSSRQKIWTPDKKRPRGKLTTAKMWIFFFSKS